MNTERTQMFSFKTTCGHVVFHHVSWYAFLATVQEALDWKLRADIQMVL